MMKKKMTCSLGWIFFLLLELGWINMSSSMHREGGNRGARRQWEKQVRSSSSLDELLRLTDFPDWKLWKCRLKLQPLQVQTEASSFPPSVGSHRSTRYATIPYSLEILKAVEEEWQSIQCMPRETCIDVAQELDSHTSVFFKPPCVSVHRCGGCCNDEGLTCRNTSTVYVNKTIFSLTPFNLVPEPVLIKVANHTACRCMEPAIIRRNAQLRRRSGCPLMREMLEAKDSGRLCASGWIWDCSSEKCIPYPSSTSELPLRSWLSDCEIDVERCECLPRPQPIVWAPTGI
ncbi:PREDICTED: vascular endothelial growth factor D [Poecilia mexicana]|uniref:Platelet-derived growth factor (PDGF) family profile domain-containing protein n=1 Tax=Poecilia mexicana TaxID=48701 RepID=A0A3B3Z5U3_9TELE|nr:PREDICTED: vascular endothelial growth factor D [Poecilia mexicana]